jgi:hypothetical protein
MDLAPDDDGRLPKQVTIEDAEGWSESDVNVRFRTTANDKQVSTEVVALTLDELQELVILAAAKLMQARGRVVYTRDSEDTHLRPHSNIEAARDQAATLNAQRFGTDPSWYGR